VEGIGYRAASQVLCADQGRPAPTAPGSGQLDEVVGGHQRNSRIHLKGALMRWIQKLSLRIRAAFRRPQVEQEMERELAEHLQSEIEELIARGVPPAKPRQRPKATMGRTHPIKEHSRAPRPTLACQQTKQ